MTKVLSILLLAAGLAAAQTYTVGAGGVTAATLLQLNVTSQAVELNGGAYLGIAQSTVAAGGIVNVQNGGIAACVFENNTTAGDLAIQGTSTSYECRDSLQTSASAIPLGTRILGTVTQAVSAGSAALVTLGRLDAAGAGTAQVPASTVAADSLLSLSSGTLMADRSDPALASFNASLASFVLATNLAPSKVVNAVVIGDSWAEGGGAFQSYSNVWAQQLQKHLQTKFGYHGTGVIPLHTASGAWTLTGTWATLPNLGPTQGGINAFNLLYQQTGAANTAAMTLKYYGDHFVVYYATYTDSGAGFGVSFDGGAATVYGAATSATYTPASVSVPVAAGWHTVTIAPPATGNVYLYGGEWIAGTSGVSVHNLARGGARAEAFGAATATELAWVPQIAGGVQLAIVSLGVNDYGTSVLPATYQTNLQNIVGYLQGLSPAPAILILDQANTNASGTTYAQSQYRAIEQALAIANGCAYLSVGERWGSYANANALGLMAADGFHPSDEGYVDVDKMLERRLIESTDANGLAIAPGYNLGLGNPSHSFGIETGSTLVGVSTAGTGAFNSPGYTTAVGYLACLGLTTGQHNTCLGRYAGGNGPSSGGYNTMVGDGAVVGATVANSVQLGGGTNSTSNTAQYVNWNFLDTSGNLNVNLTREAVGTALAAAATIAPVAPLTHITGAAAAVATITVPTVTVAGGGFKGCLKLISDGGFATAAGGNIASPALTTVANNLYLACFDGASWYVK